MGGWDGFGKWKWKWKWECEGSVLVPLCATINNRDRLIPVPGVCARIGT